MISPWPAEIVAAAVVAEILLFIRNELVYTFRQRRLDWCDEASRKAIGERKEWRQYYRSFDALTYESMLFDFRKWTYNQFYGDIE